VVTIGIICLLDLNQTCRDPIRECQELARSGSTRNFCKGATSGPLSVPPKITL
jgi:hypothetical protein